MLGVNQTALLVVSFCLVLFGCGFSGYLIRSHLRNFTQPHIQSKIVGIVYMVPIYAIDSFLCLVWPSRALFIDMLRDCYEAYVLYLFLSLLLSYLGCADDDYEVASYLATKLAKEEGDGDLLRGKQFLKNCKFGTLQYCVVRPLTALLAIALHAGGLYEEGNYSPQNSNIYLLALNNISVFYAFVSLMAFYTALKSKLQPFQPVGKFLCIKFVIFFAFWQSVFLSGAASFGAMSNDDSIALQNFLVVAEMAIVSVAHLYTFPAEPFLWAHHARSANMMHMGFSPLPTAEDIGGRRSAPTTNNSGRHLSGHRFHYNIGGAEDDLESSDDDNEAPVKSGGSRVQSSTRSALHQVPSKSYRPVTFDVETLQHSGDATSNIGDAHGYHPHRPTHLYHPRHTTGAASTHHTTHQPSRGVLATGRRKLAQTLDRHFATSTAVRDFNESMPVLHLPTGFTAQTGSVLRSDPSSRVAGASGVGASGRNLSKKAGDVANSNSQL